MGVLIWQSVQCIGCTQKKCFTNEVCTSPHHRCNHLHEGFPQIQCSDGVRNNRTHQAGFSDAHCRWNWKSIWQSNRLGSLMGMKIDLSCFPKDEITAALSRVCQVIDMWSGKDVKGFVLITIIDTEVTSHSFPYSWSHSPGEVGGDWEEVAWFIFYTWACM